ncbi:MAG: hypothetical protein AB1546_00400, partial [bacterium]
IDYGRLNVYDVLPSTLPDLFRGSQLVVSGRYRGGSNAQIKISGTAGGKKRDFNQTFSVPKHADNDFVPVIWASRRIGYLIEEIRLRGENRELVDEIIRLSKKFGIITEYTSFLVREPDAFTAAPRELHKKFAAKAAPTLAMQTGEESVHGAGVAKAMEEKSKVETEYTDSEGNTVKVDSIRRVDGRIFYLTDNRWVEMEVHPKADAIRIKTYSDAYFRLLKKMPSLGAIFALGDDVMFRIGSKIVRIGSEGKETITDEELSKLR